MREIVKKILKAEGWLWEFDSDSDSDVLREVFEGQYDEEWIHCTWEQGALTYVLLPYPK